MSKVRVVDGRGAVGDVECAVTHNLEIALRYLRYAANLHTIWVDSICIDHSNNKEKGLQINLMGEIYRLAARVIVWLGPEENKSGRAIDMLEDMGSQVDFHPGAFSITPSSQARDRRWGDMALDLPYNEEDLTCLYHLLCRAWFEGLWVRQEILLANSTAIAVCGFRDVSWCGPDVT
ncbi:hypothetical protein EPUS_09221 [Endocarpon pusillum Z07020]|uniref:Heterokaryon incompatibility domain-containing protein n=1 Tax=Endocarpon pusillum (strain Z07020 / HMAS-L-300199) TaxID=1263415 RepID=U1HN71_ENDPU|nr:uncharacterized protein EPUS_09221 [Endocarpon pusillum Z07020]ERF70479.1 hypothetical protein EPUS_09221 [Endocarpon pusillum Z07020]